MKSQSQKNREYLERNNLDYIHVVLPREDKRAFKSKTSLEGKSMNDVIIKFIKKYVKKAFTSR